MEYIIFNTMSGEYNNEDLEHHKPNTMAISFEQIVRDYASLHKIPLHKLKGYGVTNGTLEIFLKD